MNELIDGWNKGRETVELPSPSGILENARHDKKSVIRFHIGNIVVLLVVLVAVFVFFFLLLDFQHSLSHVGLVLMHGSLVIRIAVEIWSARKASRIDLMKTSMETTGDAVDFYSFRKKVHGPVTIATLGLYVLGVFLLTPEFYEHIELGWLIAMHVGFVLGGIFGIWQVRKSIRKEAQQLRSLLQYREDMAK